MKLLAALAILLCSSCGPKYDFSFAFEGRQEDFVIAAAAADSWNRCGIVGVHVTEGRDSGDQIPIQYSMNIVGQPANVGGVYLGPVRGIEYTSKEDISIVLTHEMGHALGLGHYGNGVMNASAHTADVTDDDCAQLAGR